MPPREFPEVEDLSPLPETCHATVSEDWLDVMGHMNVMWYTHVFSNAMGDFMGLFGIRKHFESGHGGAFALEAHNNYLAELHAGTALRVHSRFLGRTEKRFHVIHFLVNADANQLAATKEVVAAYVDMRTRRMAPMPEGIAAAADRLIAAHAALAWPAPVSGVMGP